jgi:hypothetical protein
MLCHSERSEESVVLARTAKTDPSLSLGMTKGRGLAGTKARISRKDAKRPAFAFLASARRIQP